MSALLAAVVPRIGRPIAVAGTILCWAVLADASTEGSLFYLIEATGIAAGLWCGVACTSAGSREAVEYFESLPVRLPRARTALLDVGLLMLLAVLLALCALMVSGADVWIANQWNRAMGARGPAASTERLEGLWLLRATSLLVPSIFGFWVAATLRLHFSKSFLVSPWIQLPFFTAIAIATPAGHLALMIAFGGWLPSGLFLVLFILAVLLAVLCRFRARSRGAEAWPGLEIAS